MKIEFSTTSEKTTCITAGEIEAQPTLWLETYKTVSEQKVDIANFLGSVLNIKDLTVILTGAGTSAYIGDVLHKIFQRNTRRKTEAVATTDLITNPMDYFQGEKTTLLVSFARSGDSPESVAAVHLANKFCHRVFHLVITCNKDGKLAETVRKDNSFVLLLPEATNDKALAMTASFTSMLLTGILISDLENLDKNREHVDQLTIYGKTILEKYSARIREIAKMDFRRAVFLGSGILKGIARESQLKLQELTDGKVICKFDSFLGLRHGPKAVIDKSTIVVYLFSGDNYINQYELDLVRSINDSENKMYEIGIGQSIPNKNRIKLDLSIETPSSTQIPEEYFSVCAVLPAQLLGLYKSMDLGLSPDSPSVSKAINRVVQGVNIYPYHS